MHDVAWRGQEDPLWKHVFPDEEQRRVGLEHFMMCYVEAGYYHGCHLQASCLTECRSS